MLLSARPKPCPDTKLVILVQPLKFVPQRNVDRFQLRQIKLPHLRLIGKRQRLIQLPCTQLRTCRSSRNFFEYARREHGIEIPHANSLAIQLLQEPLCLLAQERLINCSLQLGELLLLLDFDRRLLEAHFIASKLWSGRRESNPRPTAWKAVTLPLSYSRPATAPQR